MKTPGLSRFKGQSGRRALATALSALAGLMILGAGWLGAYPLYTNLRAGQQQEQLFAAFATPRIQEAYRSGKIKDAEPLTRIVIPKLKLNMMVVEGISLKALNTGAGHYPMSPLPGEKGNVAIAGHRTMYGKPFNEMQILEAGDKIMLITPLATHTYEVVPAFGGHSNPWVVQNNDWSAVAATEDHVLTLTTCHPKGSSKQRLVVRAKLLGSEPRA